MKSFLSLAFLASTYAESICNTCTIFNRVDGSCYLPIEGHPDQFIECSNGEPFVQTCPDGTIWSELQKTCVNDYKPNPGPDGFDSVCGTCDLVIEGKCYVPIDGQPDIYWECGQADYHKAECRDNFHMDCTFAEDVKDCEMVNSWECSYIDAEIDWLATICYQCKPWDRDHGSCYLPYPNNEHPDQFIECSNGQAWVKPCPIGTIWNQFAKTCVMAEPDVLPVTVCDACNIREYDMDTHACYLEYEGHPDKYIECSNGTPIVMPCPADLVWNEFFKKCLRFA